MSSLAEQAVEHARLHKAGQPPKTPTSAVPKISTPTGPISRHLFLEGRAWTVDMVASLKSEPAAKVIERLAGAAAGKPASYVAGVQSVIQVLASAVHGESGVLSTKVPCGSGDLSTKPVPGTELEVLPCA
ncbi:hypothetical protein PSCICO_46880 [Pseudomonas cichorii]|uniref:hypothetical protein n=1 Tax=Pseudomonas cichorii TaxID=36746 RepID=UPI00190FC212|nr:hypothetical protein [Pseudomonas cichorii]GFM89289.1 hypothetical protein PSCICO_46880 [Pseudomonas cichorii]